MRRQICSLEQQSIARVIRTSYRPRAWGEGVCFLPFLYRVTTGAAAGNSSLASYPKALERRRQRPVPLGYTQDVSRAVTPGCKGTQQSRNPDLSSSVPAAPHHTPRSSTRWLEVLQRGGPRPLRNQRGGTVPSEHVPGAGLQ